MLELLSKRLSQTVVLRFIRNDRVSMYVSVIESLVSGWALLAMFGRPIRRADR